MKRYILTGTPGCGKTAIIRALEFAGYAVVEEAATDINALRHAQGVAEAWKHPSFIDDITTLQITRQMRADSHPSELQFFDRSPVCTWALCVHLGIPVPKILSDEMARIRTERIYQPQVFFVENLGFVTPTEARRISFDDALKFEKIHEETYRSFGYECVRVPPQKLADRVEQIMCHVLKAA